MKTVYAILQNYHENIDAVKNMTLLNILLNYLNETVTTYNRKTYNDTTKLVNTM